MRIAVLGAGGMLGHKVYEVLRAEYPDTFAVFRKCPAHYSRLPLFDHQHMRGAFDARQFSKFDGYLRSLQPDLVINCIGLTTRKLGEQRESDILVVNSVLPHKLKEWCEANGASLIHFSTDCVFSGKSGPYSQSDLRDAKDLYGQSKALGEVEGVKCLTIRSSIIGLEIEGKTELLEWFLSQKGREVRGFSRVMYSGVTTLTMAQTVLKLLQANTPLSGIQQLASQPISKFDLLSLANEIFGNRCSIRSVETPESNKVLIPSDYFNKNDVHTPSWRQQLQAVADEVVKYERWSEYGRQNNQRKAS